MELPDINHSIVWRDFNSLVLFGVVSTSIRLSLFRSSHMLNNNGHVSVTEYAVAAMTVEALHFARVCVSLLWEQAYQRNHPIAYVWQ